MSTITSSRGALPSSMDPRQRPRRKPTMRRALVLLVLGLLLPGTAQMAAGSKRIGRVVFAGFLACLAALGGLYVAGGKAEFLDLAVRPRVLTAVLGALAIAGAIWFAGLVDAWRLGRPRQLKSRQRIWHAGLAALLCVVVAAPFAYAGRLTAVQHNFITQTFPDHHSARGGTAPAVPTGRLNVLLIGGDSGRNRTGLRPDSTNVVSVDLATGSSVIFGIPRNLEKFPFPRGTPAHRAFPNGFQPVTTDPNNGNNLWESLYEYGRNHAQMFPRKASSDITDPGIRAVRQAASALLGLPINHYVIINLQGFDDLVNALGGVTVRVKHPVPIGGIKTYGGYKKPSGYIEPGLRHLTGYQALWYARSRSSTNDYVRMGRQRCLMGALLDQADPFTVLRNYPKIAEASESLLHTNLPQSVLPELAHVAGKAASAHISQLGLVPPLVSVTNPDVSLIQAKVRQAIEASKSSAGAPSSKHRGGRSASPGNGPPSASPTPLGGTTKDAVKGHSVTLGATCSYH